LLSQTNKSIIKASNADKADSNLSNISCVYANNKTSHKWIHCL